MNTIVEASDKKKAADFNDAHKKKKDFREQLNNIDETFLNDHRNLDPYEFIDKKTQKIEITAKVPYRSTSQDEVFEVRNQLAEIQAIMKNNVYIQNNDAEQIKEDEDQKQFMETKWLAY